MAICSTQTASSQIPASGAEACHCISWPTNGTATLRLPELARLPGWSTATFGRAAPPYGRSEACIICVSIALDAAAHQDHGTAVKRRCLAKRDSPASLSTTALLTRAAPPAFTPYHCASAHQGPIVCYGTSALAWMHQMTTTSQAHPTQPYAAGQPFTSSPSSLLLSARHPGKQHTW